ncbi:hypothetical protein BH09BAC3_BH09BAC3_06890 [soil metagenome]
MKSYWKSKALIRSSWKWTLRGVETKEANHDCVDFSSLNFQTNTDKNSCQIAVESMYLIQNFDKNWAK